MSNVGLLKLVVFDLDGTLGDTLGSIARAVNEALAERGHPQYSEEVIRTFIGSGMRVLFEKAAPHATPDENEALCAIYRAKVSVYSQQDSPYDGIIPLLKDLHKHGIQMAIVTNKPQEAVLPCLQSLFSAAPELVDSFVAYYGLSDLSLAKPNPHFVLRLLEDLHVSKEDALYVGDSIVDVQTGRNAQVFTIGCLWGLGDPADVAQADLVVKTVADLHTYLRTRFSSINE
ncbi:Phosphoglycolate phosphatase [Giardia muris]|uniref:Phosphoglycolate phosphatase n=1 Tax=Giardia muris TaxID=5742 RepID=A0A4Z1SRZ5_GIAMU|nr:Phosphoglycolate phosphatase [Giardia muris]|eukprot:TNJ26418.1 Phosphoglycolate phosphatase [Giardia muris]